MTQEALKLALEKIATVNAMDYEYQAWAREALAQTQEPKRTGMVYYKNDACQAKDAYSHDCICWTKAPPEQEPAAWLLTDKNINSIQVDSIQRLIDRLKHAHHTDIRVRINGHDEWFEADWLNHMVRVTPPQRTEQNFCSRCGNRTKDIHTCTPPQFEQEACKDMEKNAICSPFMISELWRLSK